MTNIGLKGSWKRTKGSNLRCRLNELKYDIKYAIQRAWRGYDIREVWAFNEMFKERTITILQEYKETYHCLWWCPEGYDWSKVCKKHEWANRYMFSKEQKDAIIDTIIFHLEMSDSDYVEKKLYGKNVYDDDYKFDDRTFEYYEKIEKIRKQNQDAAMDLLKLLMDQLYD